jgi:hypothetical protein
MGADTAEGKAQGLVIDALWKHSAGSYLTDLAGLLALGIISLLVTALLLRRLDPQRPSRRPAAAVATGQPQLSLPHQSVPHQSVPHQSVPQQSRPQPQQALAQPSPPPSGRPKSWRPRSWRQWLVIVLVAMAALLVVGDRAAAAVASSQISNRVETELAAQKVEHGDLDVDVAGVPFLTQVASGTLDKITISMTDLRGSGGAKGGSAVTVTSVDVVATGVQISLGDLLLGKSTAKAQQLVGTAFITYATLDNLVKLPGLSLADIHFSESGGALRFEASGLAPVQALAEITVEKGHLRIKLRDAKFASSVLPDLGKDLLNQILAATIDLTMPALPLGLALQSVTTGRDGLSISVIGHDVLLTDGS